LLQPERGRPVADVPYTSYTADDGEYNVDNPAMEATIDYMNSVDNVVPGASIFLISLYKLILC